MNFCEEWVEEEKARIAGTYRPKVYKPLDPLYIEQCFGRVNFVRMEWMEKGKLLHVHVELYSVSKYFCIPKIYFAKSKKFCL